MAYRHRERPRVGTDPENRQEDVARLALEGVYHYEIAKRLGVSKSTVRYEMMALRAAGRVGSMHGPRAKSTKVDWTAALRTWTDPTLTNQQAVAAIGCGERTIYRRLGRRNLGPTRPERMRAPRLRRKIAPPARKREEADDMAAPETATREVEATPEVAATSPAPRRGPIGIRRYYLMPPKPKAPPPPAPQPAAPPPRPKAAPFGISALQGPDPLREIRLASLLRASLGRL